MKEKTGWGGRGEERRAIAREQVLRTCESEERRELGERRGIPHHR